MFEPLSIATGFAGAGISYFLYRCARDGVPAMVAWARAKWSAGKTEASALAADVDHAHDRIDTLERGLAQLAGEVAKLKVPSAAPAFLSPAADGKAS